MKVYINYLSSYIDDSFSLNRIISEMRRYAPEVIEITDVYDEAELVAVHIVGRHDTTVKFIDKINKSGKKYFIIQYSFRGTRNSRTNDWLSMWQGAQLVWSYYDLPNEARKDLGYMPEFNFYHAPMGANPDTFKPMECKRDYLVMTSGQGFLTESVREVIYAAQERDAKVAYLGNGLKEYRGVDRYYRIPDGELVELYNRCYYVSGLRRVEGFEMTAAEGLLCGSRPLLYDRTHHRRWFGGLADYIPETHRDQIILDLIEHFKSEYRPVTKKEIEIAKELFGWENIITGLWGNLLWNFRS